MSNQDIANKLFSEANRRAKALPKASKKKKISYDPSFAKKALKGAASGFAKGGIIGSQIGRDSEYYKDSGFYGHPKAGKSDKFYNKVQNCTGY
jgi:hypothetical protein